MIDWKNYHNGEGFIPYHKRRLKKDVGSFVKWILVATVIGLVVGGVSSIFSFALTGVTEYRESHPWVFYCMPLIGLLIVLMYDKIGKEDRGTNQVISTVRSQDEVSYKMAPMIFVSTVLTHLVGGSAGREGAAIQLGGSIGNQIGRFLHMDEEDRHVIVMCGMSAAFAALFGTPMAAAVFSMEVVSVGVMYYTALLPSVISAIIASGFAANLGIHPEAFHVTKIPTMSIMNGFKMGVIAIACAMIGTVFCIALKQTGKFFHEELKNPYIRIVVASAVIIGLTLILHTTDYMGAGIGIITKAIEDGEVGYFAFFWKLVFTVITMKAGFRGGEIVPSFCMGAALGCELGNFMGLSPSLCAAAGMVAMFCAVTNCPITSMLIAFELFGFEGAPYYLIAISVSYAVSGYYSLYKDQTIVYSKYKAMYVNKPTK